MSTPVQQASVRDTLAVLADIVTPNVAKGVIMRRPAMVAMAERLKLDRRAIRRMQRLRERYGEGPLMLRVPGRSQAVILAPEDVHRVLDESPVPFSTASSEKRAALSHFEPKGALISDPPERTDRRRFNEEVLGHAHPVHPLAEHFLPIVEEEIGGLLAATGGEPLAWEAFYEAWFRIVRRVIFGDRARDDEEITDLMEKLRASGNWAIFAPKRRRLRKRLYARMRDHLARAEPGSLAAVIAAVRKTPETAPAHQVPQWLFAFDPAGMATFRALALLATHPEHAEQARADLRHRAPENPHLPYLRACVLEALRLWPTTPLVLRQTTRETRWHGGGTMPEDTGVLIFAPFFHRDDERTDYANRFTPELWRDDRPTDGRPLIPFSDGPAICPGRHLVLLLTSAALATFLDGRDVQLFDPERLDPSEPLPATLDHFTLRFALRERPS